MQIPADDEIRAPHQRYAPSPEAFEVVYTHRVIGCEIAEQIIETAGPDVDAALVAPGACCMTSGCTGRTA